MSGGPDEAGPADRGDPGPDPADLVGTVLAGRYRIVRRLGVGAMGAVYLGEHLRIGRKDAIKVLRASMARDEEAIARFTRGARNVSRIRHPNVCTLYDFGDTDQGFAFLAMEYVDGPTLGRLLQEEGPLAPERAARLIAQVAEALQAAHALGIVHRDLKPDNIMVAREPDGTERVKVVDFDIARGPAEEEGPAVTRHGFVVGTPEYMSPEQLTGDPLDGRSDVYSMALVLFRALTARLPFEGDTAQEIMVQRLTREPLSAAEVTGAQFPAELERAIAWGLRRKAAERPDDARAFARAVLEAIAEEDTGPHAATASTAGRPIPETRVAGAVPAGEAPPRGTGPRGDGSGADRAAAGIRRPAVLAAGAGTLLVGVLAAVLLWPDAGVETTAPGSTLAGVEDPEAGPPAGADPGEPAGGDAGAGADPSASDPVAGAAGGGDSAVGDVPGGGGGPAPPRPGGGGLTAADADVVRPPPTGAVEPIPGGIRLDLAPADASAFLFAQFRLQGEDPDRITLEAVRDTVTAVLEIDGLTREDRAFAAYVLGLSLIPLGDSVQGVRWLEEAVRLDPVERHVTARDAHRGGGR